MKKKIYFLSLFFIIACVNNQGVYWCGDHPCINNKEKEAYFKKTMIVEVRQVSNKINKKDSEMEKLLNQAKVDQKKRILNQKVLTKQAKLDEKQRIKEEKELAKQAKLDKKRRTKEEKELAKQIILEEKKRINDEKKPIKKIKFAEEETKTDTQKIKIQTPVASLDLEINNEKFDVLVERIFKRNINRSYPEINDIPN